MTPDRLGWILVHSHAKYPAGDFATPQEELEVEYKPGINWGWSYPRPPRQGGPYTLLFSWDGLIFGEGICNVTHEVDDASHSFAFELGDYRTATPVALTDLPVPSHPRSLIKLTPEILEAYRRATKRGRYRGTS
jgi:hypothetical protein